MEGAHCRLVRYGSFMTQVVFVTGRGAEAAIRWGADPHLCDAETKIR